MNCFRQLCAVSIMSLMTAFSAFAGQMSCPVAAPQPPPDLTVAAGDMGTSIAEIALNLMQGVLALF